MNEPSWMTLEEALKIHQSQIDSYGGKSGFANAGQGGLESALNAPLNLFYYSEADVPTLAGAYCFHVAQAHAFADGNKRTGLELAVVFLIKNGYKPKFTPGAAVELMFRIAKGEMSKDAVIAYFSNHCESMTQNECLTI